MATRHRSPPAPIHIVSSPVMEPVSGPPSPTHSVAATAVTHWTNIPAAPDMAQVGSVLESMRNTLDNLGATFGTLGEQSSKIAGLGDGFDHASQLASLERHLAASDRKQEKRMEEIKVLLGQVVYQDIVPHVNQLIDDSIDAEIESVIEQLVQLQLAHEIPRHLQQQIKDHKKELEGVRINLANSEARRANALLRSSHLSDPLQPLFKEDGTISAHFPPNLTGLFALDGPSAKSLCLEYRLKGVTDVREKNLNLFMQFCGVAYQMVPSATYV
ncbi:hypothetical protein FRC03_003318 [Tulasnella sp. 419]|nr:hypothetical protein FRC03_003318 [Tulasnella sp. 419]